MVRARARFSVVAIVSCGALSYGELDPCNSDSVVKAMNCVVASPCIVCIDTIRCC